MYLFEKVTAIETLTISMEYKFGLTSVICILFDRVVSIENVNFLGV